MTAYTLKHISIAPDDIRGDILLTRNLETLDDLIGALHHIGNSPELYTSQKDGVSSIGAHVRHIIEFYQAFIKATASKNSTDLCYDARERNTSYETSYKAAIFSIEKIQHSLKAFSHDGSQMITLQVIVDPDKPMRALQTSLSRELFHLLDHTVHHMALIKARARQEGFILDKNFGVANATKAHLHQNKN